MKKEKNIQLSARLAMPKEAALSHSNKFDGIHLSPHFLLEEFTKSYTAQRLNIDNKPGYEQYS